MVKFSGFYSRIGCSNRDEFFTIITEKSRLAAVTFMMGRAVVGGTYFATFMTCQLWLGFVFGKHTVTKQLPIVRMYYCIFFLKRSQADVAGFLKQKK